MKIAPSTPTLFIAATISSPVAKQLAEVEARIAVLEETLADLVKEMQDPAMATDHARLYPLIERHAVLQAELDTAMTRWEELHEAAGETE